MRNLFIVIAFLLSFATFEASGEERGHNLWLDYAPAGNKLQKEYTSMCPTVFVPESEYSDVIHAEFARAFEGLLGVSPQPGGAEDAGIRLSINDELSHLGLEGYCIQGDDTHVNIEAAKDAGLLYGTFRLIREIQNGNPLKGLNIEEVPAYDLRLLNHWDGLNGKAGYGRYAGASIWKWDELPDTVNGRYEDYARANAAIGINGTVINDVNADPRYMRKDYLEKLAVLADIFRRYNIKVYLSANFAAPMKPSDTPDVMKKWGGIGNLDTADPRDKRVQEWWKRKADEIYALIPDFGGFLVKANSEGMPGPQDYGCTHADGANMLARALKPHGGIVMWRTFVYNSAIDKDRMKRSYLEFLPLDGKFDDNVILQTKNGPLDFQPSEPIQPLFGAMRQTPTMPELQITQEYTGHATYLVYLLPMWKTILDFDTFCKGEGSTVARITTGEVYSQPISAIAAVANIGDLTNWTGHHFAQANWYAYGRLAWNPDDETEKITRDWIRATWHTDEETTQAIERMMMPTWKTYMRSHTPYGIGLTVDMRTHFVADFKFRVNREWRADAGGVGSDRSSSGSNFVGQFFEPNRSTFDNPDTCPDIWLLSYHYLPWDYRMKSGKTLREEFFEGLNAAPQLAAENIERWQKLRSAIDSLRYNEVLERMHEELTVSSTFRDEAVEFFTKAINQ